MNSCLYEGQVRHRRYGRHPREFVYRLYMSYLDLAELDEVFAHSRLWSHESFAPIRFRREDYLAPSDQPLDRAVRQLIEDHCGVRPSGPIRLLTHLRHFGYVFNPVSFYYCFDEAETLQFVVAEVNNTPWNERHAYVLTRDAASDRFETRPQPKRLHVSPFLEMDYDYHWVVGDPAEKLVVHIENRREQERFFDATLTLTRQPIESRAVRRMVMRYPLMTARVAGAIHLQALKLWWKGVPVQFHPRYSDANSRGDS